KVPPVHSIRAREPGKPSEVYGMPPRKSSDGPRASVSVRLPHRWRRRPFPHPPLDSGGLLGCDRSRVGGARTPGGRCPTRCARPRSPRLAPARPGGRHLDTPPRAATRLQRDGSTVRLGDGRSRVSLTFCTPRILRVELLGSAPDPGPSFVVPRDWPAPPIEG